MSYSDSSRMRSALSTLKRAPTACSARLLGTAVGAAEPSQAARAIAATSSGIRGADDNMVSSSDSVLILRGWHNVLASHSKAGNRAELPHHVVRRSRPHRATPGARARRRGGARPAVPQGLRHAPADGAWTDATRASRPYAWRHGARARGVLPPRTPRPHRLAQSRALSRHRTAGDAERSPRLRRASWGAEAWRGSAAGHARTPRGT